MNEYRGVAYDLRWAGRWLWTIFEKPGDGVGVCSGMLECSGPADDCRVLAEVSIKAQIEELLSRPTFGQRS